MILGIGTDLVEIERIKKPVKKRLFSSFIYGGGAPAG